MPRKKKTLENGVAPEAQGQNPQTVEGESGAESAASEFVDDIAGEPDPPLSADAVLTSDVCAVCGIASVYSDGARKACTYCGSEQSNG